MGGALDATTIPELGCLAVVGAANNQLADPGCDELLEKTGVLYAPDYVVNAGGVINIAEELAPPGLSPHPGLRGGEEGVRQRVGRAGGRRGQGSTTAVAADNLAERRIAEIGHVHQLRVNG